MRRFVCAISLSALLVSLPAVAQSKPAPAAGGASAVARGKYLVEIMACNDCHTPMKMGAKGPEPDMTRMLSGHPASLVMPPAPALPPGPWLWTGSATLTAFAGPWGVTYAANLTPDPNTGLGIWTEDMFMKSMRTGKHMATSRMIQPPMPWNWIGKATDADLKAIYAYLKSVPPIVNRVPDYQEPKGAPGAAPAAPSAAPAAPAKRPTPRKG